MIPTKPFASYKWRWLSVEPTESLLEPEVFLGVLRVLARHVSHRYSDNAIINELRKVKKDTKTKVDLVRTADRNLFRNSGQYWKGTGLLLPTRGKIQLTTLGERVASGKITQSEFVAIMVQQTVLPNPWTYKPDLIKEWERAGLEIKPLLLLIQICNCLHMLTKNSGECYLTPNELIKIVIPLAGAKKTPEEIAGWVLRFRKNPSITSGWPNCTPRPNDVRCAREFLLFLANYGIFRKVDSSTSATEEYHLDEPIDINAIETKSKKTIFSDSAQQNAVIDQIRHSPFPSLIERQRTYSKVLSRPSQKKFRRDVLKAYTGRCFLSGESIEDVLEAAHIIPVEKSGSDMIDNGVCLRVDIHTLFDSGNIRIKPNGDVFFSEIVEASLDYRKLPKSIVIPAFVKPANLCWRDSYL